MALVYVGEVYKQESEHAGVICGHTGMVWNVHTGSLRMSPGKLVFRVLGSGCTFVGGVCMWLHLCFGGGLGRPSAEPGSAVPSLVAKSLKSLPFQQQLSRRRSSSDLGGEGEADPGALRGRRWAGVRGCGEGLVGLEEGSPPGDRRKD